MRLCLGLLAFINFYIPLTTTLEGNWLLEAASRELKLLRDSEPR